MSCDHSMALPIAYNKMREISINESEFKTRKKNISKNQTQITASN